MANNLSNEYSKTAESSYSSVIEALDEMGFKLKNLCDFKVNHWTKPFLSKEKDGPVLMKIKTNDQKMKSALKELGEKPIRDIVENARNIGLKVNFSKSMNLFSTSELSIIDSISIPIVHMFTEKNVYIYQKGDVYIGGDSKMFAKDMRINSLAQIYRNYPPLEVLAENLFFVANNGCIHFNKCHIHFDGPVLTYGYKIDEGFIPDYKAFITDRNTKIVANSECSLFVVILLEVKSLKLFLMIKGKFKP